MKKKLIYALAIITTATTLFIKANKTNQGVTTDTVLANVEALASNEIIGNGYFCYGEGKIVCPDTGQMVAGYYKKRNLE